MNNANKIPIPTNCWKIVVLLTQGNNDLSRISSSTISSTSDRGIGTKLTFLTKNKFWGFYVSYEYGELPPAYKVVDHKAKLGLVFSAAKQASSE